MPDRFIPRIVEHLRHEDYEATDLDGLMEDLGVSRAEGGVFAEAVKRLRESGTVEVDGEGRVKLPAVGSEVTGVLRKNQRGFGFVVPEKPIREGDVFIPPTGMADALNGDTVRVEIDRYRKGENKISGKIVSVVKRKRQKFTGEVAKRGNQWVVYPDGRSITEPIVVKDADSKNARAGMKAVVEVVRFPEAGMLAEGVILEILGEAGLPSVETQATIAAYDLPGEFPEACVAQARRATEQFEREVEELTRGAGGGGGEWDPTKREDRTKDFICTIDPPDAKDYDDAISIVRSAEGWRVGVHIADVAHFIPAGTPLDVEAAERGNSCYLPRHVIPMLPEVLSNGICSLQEGVVRFCKSAFMDYDRAGRVVRQGMASVAIRSAKRLTYLEAQALIDGDETEAKKHAKTEPVYTEQLVSTLREMDACARAIRQRRREQGMIHLELPDVVLLFDDEGRVIDAEREDDAFTHTIIEMLMVEANECAARVFERLGVPLLRRIHPDPTPGDVDDLRQAAKVAGFTIPKKPSRMELQAVLDATRGTPAAPAVHFAVLRTLTRAEYSPALVGHFALASEAYAHFTSPIRRYADLTVHRALAEFLRRTANGSRPPREDGEWKALGKAMRESDRCPSHEDLVRVGRHCTRMEENASQAEEDLKQFLVLQLMADHIGEEFQGMITGATNIGVFVQLEKYLADGLIKAEDLPTGKSGQTHGRWRIDPRSGRLAHESGRSYGIGDRVTVRIANVDLAMRKMDLVIADAQSREKGKAVAVEAERGGGVGGGSIQLDWERFKGGGGAGDRNRRSKSRDRGKGDFRKERKDKGKK